MRVALLIVLAFTTRAILACSCAGLRDVASQVKQTGAVFAATIISKHLVVRSESWGPEFGVDATARVGRVWKGDPPATVRIRTGLGGGDCGVHLDLGATYVIFGHAYTDGSAYGTGACTLTSRVNPKLLAALGAPYRDLGGEGAPPHGRRRLLNIWSMGVTIVVSAMLLPRWQLIVAAIVITIGAIVVRRRAFVAITVWTWSLCMLADLPLTLWITFAAMLAVMIYTAIRTNAARLLDDRTFRIAASLALAAILVLVEPRLSSRSILGVLIGMTQTPIIVFVIVASLWYASFSRRAVLAIPAALLLALLATRTHAPWYLVMTALQ